MKYLGDSQKTPNRWKSSQNAQNWSHLEPGNHSIHAISTPIYA